MSNSGFGDLTTGPVFKQPEKLDKKKVLSPLEADPGIGSKTINSIFKPDNIKINDSQAGKENIIEKKGYIKLYENAAVDLSDAREINTAGTISGVYKPQFNRTFFDKMRGKLDLDQNPGWATFIDRMMKGDAKDDDVPPIEPKEIANLKSHIKPGDILINGNNCSYIHGILYVGKDKELQDKLEKQWGLKKGELNDEGIIIHSLVDDSDKVVETDGKQEILKAAGTGVVADTIERFSKRHKRDMIVAVSVKNSSEKDRQDVINAGKKLVGKPYDRAFNTYDEKAVYCTELVMRAWSHSSHPPEFHTQIYELLPFHQLLLDKLPKPMAKTLQDRGLLGQELIMIDGIAASPSVDIIWASKDAVKTDFFKKHERWSEGIKGNISEDYKKLLQENFPEIAPRSGIVAGKIKELSQITGIELNK